MNEEEKMKLSGELWCGVNELIELAIKKQQEKREAEKNVGL